MNEEITFTCAKSGCFDAAYGVHAVCKKHFVVDFLLVVLFGVLVVGFLVYFARRLR